MIHPSEVLPIVILAASGVSQLALAQDSQDVGDSQLIEEIVVTGTLIRGIEPTGSRIIALDERAIADLAAVTTNDLLATIPQVTNFFNNRPEQDPRGADRLQVNRPNLRNLPGINSATGATTLILLDGRRLAPVGTDQASLDPDVIPAVAMRRIEVVTDGGSSLYGADAVGGVVNFATYDQYEGIKLDVGYDSGDDYENRQASVIAGTSWERGSGYFALATTDRDPILKADREWALQGNWSEEGTVLTPFGTECLEPVGAVTTWFWWGGGWTNNPAAPGAGVTPVGDACDREAHSVLIPEQQRDSFFAALTHQFSERVSLKLKTYYMGRSTAYTGYPTGDTVSEPGPGEQGIQGSYISQLYQSSAVGFSYGVNPAYAHRDMELNIETWGITPEFTIDVGESGWQSRTSLYYGESDNSVYQPLSNRARMLDYVASGALDPLSVATADASVIQDILNWENADEVEQEVFSIRSIADGEVTDLPAGTVRAALGIEYLAESVEKRTGEANRSGGTSLPEKSADRDVLSVFGELSVPLVETLDLSLSARYDDYEDFGDTFNPNIGLDWQPTEWIKVYGKWGESFNAPTTLDSVIVANGRYVPDRTSSVPDPNMEWTNPSRDDVFLIEGGSGALQPQSAESWGLGFGLNPLPGLEFDLYYYSIEFVDLLASPNPQDPQAVLLNPEKFIFLPTDEEWARFLASVDNPEQFPDIVAEDIGVIIDRRITNTDSATLKGFDFTVRYSHDVGFGQMSYGFSGNHAAEFELVQTGTATDPLAYAPDLRVSANITWTGQQTRANLNFRYTDDYTANPGIAVNQDSVDEFLTTNLLIGYRFAGTGMAEGLSLQLNVDNMFDEDPPVYRSQQGLNYSESSWTLGRVFKLALTYSF